MSVGKKAVPLRFTFMSQGDSKSNTAPGQSFHSLEWLHKKKRMLARLYLWRLPYKACGQSAGSC